MRLLALLALLALAAGCAGIEADIERAEIGEFFQNFYKGKDRGVGSYCAMIEKSITPLQGGRYQYVPPAHMSNFYVDFSVRGLGGTKLLNSDYLARAADKLLWVLAHDPTGALRSTAAEQLGRLLLPLPPGPVPLPTDGAADIRINQIADDLLEMSVAVREGKKVPVTSVVERLHALAAERPTGLVNALQMVRIFAAPPVAGAVSGPVRETAEQLGPAVIRDSILVALRDVSVGLAEVEPDESPLVRKSATEVLTRVASPVAQAGAITRLTGEIDPPERDPDVRCALVAYLGVVGGPGAFDACVERLLDLDIGVRFYAQTSLQQLTGARADPTPEAWRAWAEKAPALAKAAR
jgi:hypothetical protein